MKWKKLGKALLFPHIAIMIMLIPIATVFLVYSMVYLGTESVTASISYVLAFYTLTVWCIKIPYLIHFFKTFKEENKYVRLVSVRAWFLASYILVLFFGGILHCTCGYAFLFGAVYRSSQTRRKNAGRTYKIPCLWHGVSCYEPGTCSHHLLYGLLEQDLRASYDNGDRDGGLHLHRANRRDHQRCKVQKI